MVWTIRTLFFRLFPFVFLIILRLFLFLLLFLFFLFCFRFEDRIAPRARFALAVDPWVRWMAAGIADDLVSGTEPVRVGLFTRFTMVIRSQLRHILL